ncbi:MAG: thioredoxin family protein [Actinomycetota bacterium]
MGEVVEATRENFKELIAEGVVLVDVWGQECQPCLALNPHVKKIAEENPDISVVKLEGPKARRISIELKIMGMPAFLLFRDGVEVDRFAASQMTPAQLRTWLKRALENLDEPAEAPAGD